MTILIEAEAKEIAELLTLAVSDERLIEKKIADSFTKVANGISSSIPHLPELLKEFPRAKSSEG